MDSENARLILSVLDVSVSLGILVVLIGMFVRGDVVSRRVLPAIIAHAVRETLAQLRVEVRDLLQEINGGSEES